MGAFEVPRRLPQLDEAITMRMMMMTVLSLAAFFSRRPQVNSFNIHSRLGASRTRTYSSISGSYVKYIFGLNIPDADKAALIEVKSY